MQAVGAYNQARAQQAALRAETQVALNNATIAGWQADDAAQRGEIEAGRVLVRGAQMKGAQRAAVAANGIDLGVGSGQAAINDTDYYTQVDANTVLDNAAREAWGYRMGALDQVRRAKATSSAAESVNPWLAAGTSLLTSATSVARGWYSSSSSLTSGGGGVNFPWAFGTGRGVD